MHWPGIAMVKTMTLASAFYLVKCQQKRETHWNLIGVLNLKILAYVPQYLDGETGNL